MKSKTDLIFLPNPDGEFASHRSNAPMSQPTPRLDYRAEMVVAYRHYLDKNFALALAIYRRVLAQHAKDPAALSGEAWSLYYLGLEDQAAVDFRTLLHANSADCWARKGLSLCEGGAGRGYSPDQCSQLESNQQHVP